MTAKPVVPRQQALRDVDDAIAHYLQEDAPEAALGFIAALERAYAHLGRQPATGSPRWAHELGLPGLRAWQLTRSPYLVFHVERAGHGGSPYGSSTWPIVSWQRPICHPLLRIVIRILIMYGKPTVAVSL